MTVQSAKRFYTQVAVATEADGFRVELDGRPVKTPGRSPLRLPSRPLAESVAEEWDRQAETLVPETMPLTRLSNTALDRISPRRDEAARLLADYAAADLICYRAEVPDSLVAAQARAWDEPLSHAARGFGIRLKPTSGIMPVDQPADSLEAAAALAERWQPFAVTALVEAAGAMKSLLLALYHLEGPADLETVWAAATVDERHQESLWGVDAEAEAARAALKADLAAAGRLYALLRQADASA
ncbi:ATP12 family chaperone protein [Yunchengibacter salinarum]|uniref:ATP12 family chaperone protein n=1 Tax=Yunchengibacter salinarum TaxID=3133399 RepID=UPI0035B5FC76